GWTERNGARSRWANSKEYCHGWREKRAIPRRICHIKGLRRAIHVGVSWHGTCGAHLIEEEDEHVRGTLLALVLISCSTVACGSDAIHDTASALVATVPAKQYLV